MDGYCTQLLVLANALRKLTGPYGKEQREAGQDTLFNRVAGFPDRFPASSSKKCMYFPLLIGYVLL